MNLPHPRFSSIEKKGVGSFFALVLAARVELLPYLYYSYFLGNEKFL